MRKPAVWLSAAILGGAAVLVLATDTGPDHSEVAAATAEGRPVGQAPGVWHLVFSDEFDGARLGPEWVTCYWWDQGGCTNKATNERGWYLPDQVHVEDGVLMLTAEAKRTVAPDGTEYPFASGMVSTGRIENELDTDPGFALRYGYVEMRARIPAGAGLWPAFWLLPVTHDAKPEIDVMEILGQRPDRFLAHIHWRDESGAAHSDGRAWRGPDFSLDWHTYAAEWTPDAVHWYVDGKRRWSFVDPEHVPSEDMYLIVNLAVGGDHAGPVDSDALPATFEVDYVRVWQRSAPG